MIKKFQDMVSWQESHRLVLIIYEITKMFPENERFCLINQLRRATISITSNITEGFGRISKKDKKHFFIMARASLSEVECQILIARDLKYINSEKYKIFDEQASLVGRLITGLIKYCDK